MKFVWQADLVTPIWGFKRISSNGKIFAFQAEHGGSNPSIRAFLFKAKIYKKA